MATILPRIKCISKKQEDLKEYVILSEENFNVEWYETINGVGVLKHVIKIHTKKQQAKFLFGYGFSNLYNQKMQKAIRIK